MQAKAPSSASTASPYCAASESSQSGGSGGTEDNPVSPVATSAAAVPTATIPHNKPTAVDVSPRTISSASTDLDDEEWVEPDAYTAHAPRFCPAYSIPIPDHRED